MTDDPWIWNKKLGPASMKLIEKLVKNKLFFGLPKLDYSKDHLVTIVKMENKLETLFPVRILSPQLNLYNSYTWTYLNLPELSTSVKKGTFVTIDDYSHFNRVMFLSHKDDTLKNFEFFYEKVQRDKVYYITSIRSDHGGEFENNFFEMFCNEKECTQNFSSP